MLKSTKEKINNEIVRNTLIQDSINAKKEELKEAKRHNLIEEETKDRVNISKKEYLELLKKVEELNHNYTVAHETIVKILRPFAEYKVSDKFVNKILANDFAYRVEMRENPVTLKTNIFVIYECDSFDMR